MDNEDDISKLELLIGEDFVGIDAEWKPVMTKGVVENPSILQLSSKNHAIIVDILALTYSERLNEMLTRLFSSHETAIVGFGLHTDLDVFARQHQNLDAFKFINRFIDAQTYYGALCNNGDRRPTGLAKVARALFGKEICKVERMSNWESRPLKDSQRHYAALDAFILVDII